MTRYTALVLTDAFVFLVYGISLLISSSMVIDFERFGLAKFRVLTGVLEVLGAVGVVAGIKWPIVTPFAAAGLCLLMLAGVIVRVRSGDGVLLSLPAALLMIVNGYIALRSSSGQNV